MTRPFTSPALLLAALLCSCSSASSSTPDTPPGAAGDGGSGGSAAGGASGAGGAGPAAAGHAGAGGASGGGGHGAGASGGKAGASAGAAGSAGTHGPGGAGGSPAGGAAGGGASGAAGGGAAGGAAGSAGGGAAAGAAGAAGAAAGAGATGGGAGADTAGGAAGAGAAGGAGATGGAAGQGAAGGGGGAADQVIGEWTDAPGACPAGLPVVDITAADQLASASRGESPFDTDAPATCYFIHNGVYNTTGVVMYVLKGGEAGGKRRYFIGESRAGVVIHGRGNIEDGTSDVTVANLTFDLTGYQNGGSFNTLNLGNGRNVTVDHVTFTGDCATGLQGGHIETNKTDTVLIEACLVEKFGQCSGDGHLDHGVYLGAGSNIVLRNNVIRGNSSRGIQLNTEGGTYGTIDKVTIENNRIYGNGHRDYEDGIVVNSSGTGTITNVTIQRNLIFNNYYSGIRFSGGAESGFVVSRNTFDSNGQGSALGSRSEINIDSMGSGAGTSVAQNIFNVGNTLINDCYDAASLGFGLGDNFVHGPIPSGAAAACVKPQTAGDPQFAAASAGDYHPQNPAAQAYGAFAP